MSHHLPLPKLLETRDRERLAAYQRRYYHEHRADLAAYQRRCHQEHYQRRYHQEHKVERAGG